MRLSTLWIAAAFLAGITVSAQLVVPELAYDAAVEPLKLPPNMCCACRWWQLREPWE